MSTFNERSLPQPSFPLFKKAFVYSDLDDLFKQRVVVKHHPHIPIRRLFHPYDPTIAYFTLIGRSLDSCLPEVLATHLVCQEVLASVSRLRPLSLYYHHPRSRFAGIKSCSVTHYPLYPKHNIIRIGSIHVCTRHHTVYPPPSFGNTNLFIICGVLTGFTNFGFVEGVIVG